MSKQPRVFRTEVPAELVLKFYQTIGVKSFDDVRWWSKHRLTPSVCKEIDELLPSLIPYYYPHKRFLIQREMNTLRYIQIFRHLAKAIGMTLESKEQKDKYQNRKKITLYRLKSEKNNFLEIPVTESTFIVRFDD
jgi:hypothetical protein